ncbi:MAG: hypothetical protein N2554_02370 [Fimbriimonadales bacterium]|nr:hypothetical protein [Fimbriimonadales bacterium]
MLRKELYGIPIGMWVFSALYALLNIILRSYYIDFEGLRQIAAASEGFSRVSTTWWSGHSVLGVALLWLVTLPLKLVIPLVDAAQVVSALSVWLSGLVLFRILRLTGLSAALSGWIAFLFYGANVAWVSASMLPVASLSLLLTAWWGLSAIRWLAARELDSAGGTRLGVMAGLLGLVNLFALIPGLAAGINAMRRGGGAGLLGAALGVALIGYLAVYFVVLPAQVQVGGAVRPKPSIVEWFWTGEGTSAINVPRYSGLYWRMVGEQAQGFLLSLGQPFRVRDVYQYVLGGGFVTLVKGFFLLLALICVIVLGTLQFSGERVATDRLVSAVRGLGGGALLLSLLVLVLWQGDRQAFYLWTLFWALVGLGGWLGSYVEEDARRVSLVIPALALTLLVFGLMKTATLRSTEHDGERQEAEAVSTGIRDGDVLVASTRIAEWLRYYAAGKAQAIDASCWLNPETDFRTTLQTARQEGKRVVLWDYALNPEIYQRAELVFNPAWLESLGKAQTEARNAGGAYLRRFANLVVYPTLTLQAGEVQTFVPQP